MAVAGPAEGLPAWRVAAAHRELLESVLSQTRVARSPVRPSAVAYLDAWVEALKRWLSDVVPPSGLVDRIGTGLLAVTVLVVAAALAIAGVAIVRALRQRAAAKAKPGEAAGGRAVPLLQATDAQAWRREILERIGRGDVGAALEALWWWLARSLAGDGADSSWTTRELLVRSRRLDLIELAKELDTLMYAQGRPAPSDVTACLDRLERAVA